VLSANATSLVAEVPAGAATGPIQVATAGGSATSSGDFTVLSGIGAAWTTRLAGPCGRPSGIAWTGARFAAVGSGAGFQASEDALVWRVSSGLSSADDVAWDGSMMVAVGSSFWVSTSTDGLTWTTRSLPAGSADLHGVARSPETWVAVGNGICSSPDGVTWTARDSGTTKQLRAVTWTGAQFVAVGEDGAVVTSPDGLRRFCATNPARSGSYHSRTPTRSTGSWRRAVSKARASQRGVRLGPVSTGQPMFSERPDDVSAGSSASPRPRSWTPLDP
jgi:hypothetical protein